MLPGEKVNLKKKDKNCCLLLYFATKIHIALNQFNSNGDCSAIFLDDLLLSLLGDLPPFGGLLGGLDHGDFFAVGMAFDDVVVDVDVDVSVLVWEKYREKLNFDFSFYFAFRFSNCQRLTCSSMSGVLVHNININVDVLV